MVLRIGHGLRAAAAGGTEVFRRWLEDFTPAVVRRPFYLSARLSLNVA